MRWRLAARPSCAASHHRFPCTQASERSGAAGVRGAPVPWGRLARSGRFVLELRPMSHSHSYYAFFFFFSRLAAEGNV
jgi:hypothetical protein